MSNQSKSSKSLNMPRSGKDDPTEFSAGYWAMKELQSVVAFRAYESVVTSAGSRSLKQLQDLVFEKYHGDLQNNKHELGIQIFERILDEVNKEEETWKALVLARPERFDDPAALADWYPFQQWKAAEKKKEQILKEMHGFGKNLL
ncbi:hypothetical protein IV203_036792 [Nitzschia inconspicua]|uniref:Uncharacterized protein n=1 Tax=Nitzschia inconspicua TaxID=303405 RepID=A0A9K3PW69_9STRA|nr:hypothetical protein IV203_036792 [Nitzschia inconspicua]